MRKALQVASVASMIDQFGMCNINLLQELGYQVDVAANFEFGNTTSKKRINDFKKELADKEVSVLNLLFDRKVFNFINIDAYRKLKKIINDNCYEIIHCHSPIGGVITRLAAMKARKNGTKVIYTAHGFHFYKGSPLKNWIIFYSIEKILSRFVDVIITINKEDYELAKNKFKKARIEYVPGVGINTKKIQNTDCDMIAKKETLNIEKDALVLMSIGELNNNKNHKVVIEAMSKIKNLNIYYIICGIGDLKTELENSIEKYGLQDKVKLLGYRDDIYEICKISDVFVFPSFREGLSVALMEAMSAGLPIICSDIRGNRDLIEDGLGGYLINPHDVNEVKLRIECFYNNLTIRNKFRDVNLNKIKEFDEVNVRLIMKSIYIKA